MNLYMSEYHFLTSYECISISLYSTYTFITFSLGKIRVKGNQRTGTLVPTGTLVGTMGLKRSVFHPYPLVFIICF